jgi:choline dehydrogenase-like flavoprotein
VSSYHHHSGTCRMGDPDTAGPDTAGPGAAGPGAAGIVTGPDLAVLGTSRLSVADSSVIPLIPRANTNLASMMIGYRSGDVIAS